MKESWAVVRGFVLLLGVDVKIVIMRGIPGSGKSTWAQDNYPDALVVSTDHYFVDGEGQYEFRPNELGDAHMWAYGKFVEAVADGIETIVVDNTNIHCWELTPYLQYGRLFGYKVEVVAVVCDPKEAVGRCIHNVPERLIYQMYDALRPLPGHIPEHRVTTELVTL